MDSAKEVLLQYDTEGSGKFVPPPPKKMRSTPSTLLRVVGISLGAAVVGLAVAAAVIFGADAMTLRSVQRAEEQIITMQYKGSSQMDRLLEQGAESEAQLERFISRNLLLENDIDVPAYAGEGIAFTARNGQGDVLMCRSLRRGQHPAVLVEADGVGAYASLAALDMAMLGYDAEGVPESFGINKESLPLLAAPLLSLDGVNEMGVAAVALPVNTSECAAREDKTTLCANTLVRLVLERAASAEEALTLLEDCNVVFEGCGCVHIVIADRSGAACVAEWDGGELHTVRGSGEWLAAANRLLWNDSAVGDSKVREYKVSAELEAAGGVLSEAEAFALLEATGGRSGIPCSVIYNLTTGEVTMRVGEGDSFAARLRMKN